MGTNPFRGQRAVHPLTSEDIGSAATRLSASVQLDGPDHRADAHGHGATGPHPVRSSPGSPRDGIPTGFPEKPLSSAGQAGSGGVAGRARATASFRAATTLTPSGRFRRGFECCTGLASDCACVLPPRIRSRCTRRGSRSWGPRSGAAVSRSRLRGGWRLPVARPERRVHLAATCSAASDGSTVYLPARTRGRKQHAQAGRMRPRRWAWTPVRANMAVGSGLALRIRSSRFEPASPQGGPRRGTARTRSSHGSSSSSSYTAPTRSASRSRSRSIRYPRPQAFGRREARRAAPHHRRCAREPRPRPCPGRRDRRAGCQEIVCLCPTRRPPSRRSDLTWTDE